MPSLHNTATPALALFFVLISGSTGQVERELQPIACGQTVTVTIASGNDFFPFMLDLTSAAGNKRLDFHTCSSLVRDPDLCLGAEYIDDDQIRTSNSGGDCLWRNPTGNPVGLGENVSYVVVPGTHPIQIGTYRGSGNVTLVLACSDTTDVATVLKSNPDKCFGDRSVLTRPPTPGPTSAAPTVAPSAAPTPDPTTAPTAAPGSSQPTAAPTPAPTAAPASLRPTMVPSVAPSSASPTAAPTATPGSSAPTTGPMTAPASSQPTSTPSAGPMTSTPTAIPSAIPTTVTPTVAPSAGPTTSSSTTQSTTSSPTSVPTTAPSGSNPTVASKTANPTAAPSAGPTTSSPTSVPTTAPAGSNPTATPTAAPAASVPTPPPTAGPSSTSPTPAPTTPPTRSPNTPAPTSSPATTGPTPTRITDGPTVPPSTSPTRNMTLVNLGATDNRTDQSAATSSWWPAPLVLLLLTVLLLIGFMVRRGPKKETADDSLAASAEALNPMFADLMVADDAAAAALLVPFLTGDEPIYALAGENNALYDTFRRAVAFDTMYYGNPPLAVDNGALAAVYEVLGTRLPAPATMAPLRELCQRFFDSVIDTAAPSEAVLYDVVKFMWAAIADELVERAIDALASQGCGPAVELGGTSNTEADLLERALYELCEDYFPVANEYLIPVDGAPNSRALPPTSWEHEAMYDIGGIGGGDLHGADTYELAGGAIGAIDYSMADFQRNSVCLEYALSSPHTGAALGGDATYALAAGDEVAETEHDDNIYSMASGNAETVETMYDFGAGSRPMRLVAGNDATYDLAGTQVGDTDCDTLRTRSHGSGGDPVYDMAGRLEHLAVGTKGIEQLYDNVTTATAALPMSAAALSMSAAAKRMSAAVMSVYDTVASDACPRSPAFAVYDAASTWQAGAIESDCDDRCSGGEPETYLQVLGVADGSGKNAESPDAPIVPAFYETAAGSAEYEDELGDVTCTLSTVNPEYVTPRPGSVFVDADMQLRFKSVHRQSPFASAH